MLKRTSGWVSFLLWVEKRVTSMCNGHGGRGMQKKRSKVERAPRTKYKYWCIDGNETVHPSAYCNRYEGVLTNALMQTHKCREKGCKRLEEMSFE